MSIRGSLIRSVGGVLFSLSLTLGLLEATLRLAPGLLGGNLANALTQLSGEAATGGQQVAFQLSDQFLELMLDPFVDGRRSADGGALGFAPEREALPADIALAYSSVLKAPAAQAAARR